MEIAKIIRVFIYNGIRLPDPGADLSAAQVKDYYSAMYPELTTAEVTSPKENGDAHEYTFRKTTGTKGMEDVGVPFVERLQAAASVEAKQKVKREQTLATLGAALRDTLTSTGVLLAMPSQVIPLLL
ncbi:MAG: PRTRC system protein C [Nitrospiraceae bacterium]